MTFIRADDKIVNVKLTSSEIERIIEQLEYAPYCIFEFMDYEEIVKKLKKAK